MLKSTLFISQQSMENHIRPHPRTAVISITTPGDRDALIPDGFHSVLRLKFDDLYEESMFGENVGGMPDIGLNNTPILWHNMTVPDGIHARQIFNFIIETDCDRLIVHCHQGISRSAAIAQFAADRFCAELIGANPDTSGANRRLLRLLNKVADGIEMTSFEYSGGTEIFDPVQSAYAQTQGIF